MVEGEEAVEEALVAEGVRPEAAVAARGVELQALRLKQESCV